MSSETESLVGDNSSFEKSNTSNFFNKKKIFFFVAVFVIVSIFIIVTTLGLLGEFSKSKNGKSLDFGKNIRKSSFYLAPPEARFLNHGSYGAVPKPVFIEWQNFQTQMEQAPDTWFSSLVRPLCSNSLDPLANFINSTTENLVWVENASNGINSVLRSFKVFSPNETILYTSWAYGMVKETLYFLRDQYGVQLLEVQIPKNLTKENIIETIKQEIENNPSITFATFCHITSIPSIILPIKELLEICHKKNIPVLVDGAHALGQIPIDIEDLNPDFYLANAHKWLYSPRGSAFLYIKDIYQDRIQPPVVSFGYNKGIRKEFEWIGTRDYSAWPATAKAIEWYNNLGGEAIRNYQRELCDYANTYLSQLFNSQNLVKEDDSLIPNSMTNIGLPLEFLNTNISLGDISYQLKTNYQIFSSLYEYDGLYYIRLSCQIYNDKSDVHAFGEAVLEILKKINDNFNC